MVGCWGLKGSTFFWSVTLGRPEGHLQIEWAGVEMQDDPGRRVLSLSHAGSAGCLGTRRVCRDVWNGAPHTRGGWRASAAVRASCPGVVARDRSLSLRDFLRS